MERFDLAFVMILALIVPWHTTFADEFVVRAKAEPDEFYNGFGNTYVPIGEEIPADKARRGSRPKVNYDYLWGMTASGKWLWFGTAANILSTSTSVTLGIGIERPHRVNEGIFSKYPLTPPFTRFAFGDWRPPRIFCYDVENDILIEKTPKDPLLNIIAGLRSAGANDEVVLIAGQTLYPLGLGVFAFDAKTHEYLGSRFFLEYANIRRWVNVNGQLYTAIRGSAGFGRGGLVLRWAGTIQDPFRFTEVGRLDQEGAYICEHEGRLYVSTWPSSGTSDALMGIWMSPELGDAGLDESDFHAWVKVWDVGEFEPDPAVAETTAGGAICSFDGCLYWGTFQLPGTSALPIIGQDYTLTPNAEFIRKTLRPISIFRGRDLPAPASREVELLYGDDFLWKYDEDAGEFALAANKTGKATHGQAGFAPSPFKASELPRTNNFYTWSMEVHDGKLYVGTFDNSTLMAGGILALLKGDVEKTEAIARRIGVEDPAIGADLWCFPPNNETPYPVTRRGAGNPYNHGIRNLVSTHKGLFLGTTNSANLMTLDGLPKGGWELIQLVKPEGVEENEKETERPEQHQFEKRRDTEDSIIEAPRERRRFLPRRRIDLKRLPPFRR